VAQQRVISDFERAIRDAGASPREALALQEAGIVESGLTALSGGDRDSTGALQQRPSQGWGPVGESAYTDAMQFLSHARSINRKGFKGSAGALAQAVQRSAFPDRYDKAKAGAVKAFGGSTPVGSAAGASNSSASSLGVGAAPSLAEILNAAAPEAAPASPQSALAAPDFAARAVTPEGYQPVQAQQAPVAAQAPDLGELAAQVAGTVDTSLPSAAGAGSGASAAPSAARGGGKVTIAAGANRPGTSLTPQLTRLLEELPFDVTVGTGTNHSRLTVNGKVSDHVSGNAADIPATGKALTRDLARALATYAPGQVVQWERNDGRTVNVKVTPQNVMKLAAAGGLFNVPHGKGRIQVIGNSHIGGDHTNHLHIGRR
jgi:hypothetical protein